MRPLLTCLVVCCAAALGLGCLWDSDTLDDELRGLPDPFYAAIGRWWRHDEAYYRARIDRLPAVLARNADDLAAADDLAVAYDRLGQHDAALTVLAGKEQALARRDDAEHRYRLHANRGTVLAHAGRHAEALVELDRALAINPQAHFDRERYQVHLVHYYLAARERPELWAQSNCLEHAGMALPMGVIRRERLSGSGTSMTDAQLSNARAAFLGILRFGGTEAAEVYRTLGDLALGRNDLHLAWCCFAMAIERGHPAATVLQKRQTEIEEHFVETLDIETPLADAWRNWRANGDAWLAAFRAGERDQLRRGGDSGSDAALTTLIALADRTVPPPATHIASRRLFTDRAQGIVVSVALALIACLAALWFWRRRRARR